MKRNFTKIASLLLCFCLIISGMIITTSAETTAYYEKVTAAPEDWSGEYLIVYETGKVAFNGALGSLDATSNTIPVTISDNKIAATDALKGSSFTIAKSGSTYTIKSASGYYVGNTSNANALKAHKTTTYANTFALKSAGNEIDIVSSNSYLRYNATSGQTRFRYYKSSSYTNQKAIQLYKYVEVTTEEPGTGGEGGGETPDPEVPDEPEVPEVQDPTPGTELTIEAAAALGLSKEHDNYTEGSYYVTGIVVSVANTTYGNMTIKDANDETKTLDVFGTYSADGSTRYDAMEIKPEAGDTVKLYGIIGQYNGTAQMKNAKLIEHVDINPPVEPEPDVPGGDTPQEPTGNTATITFDNTSKRTEFSTTKQVWVENGITVTNNKSSSTSPVADYANPVRFYKNSQLIVATSKKIAKIEFFADTTGYANDLKSAIGNKATVNDKIVTFIPDAPDTSFEFTLSVGKVFLDSITITYEAPVAEMGSTSATVGANLGIQQSITLKTEDAANKTLKMDFTIGDNTTTVDPVITDGNYTFSFNNIPAHFMTEEITATLYVQEGDDKVEQGTNKYTIAEYGKAILESADYTTEVKKFVANMLTYGAAAQKKANHNTDNLATAGLETLISQFGSNEAPSADDKMSLSKTDSDVRFYSANVKFSDVNNLIIKLNAEPGNLKLFVNGVEKTLNGKEYISEDIKATDYATKFTFELKDGDTVIQTLTYGINSYAYSMYNKASTSTEMKNLASALYAYGVSASNLK